MWWPFNNTGETRRLRWPLSMSLLKFSQDDHFTLADACEGVQVFGATGGGKSSGSGRQLALAYLRAGMGGLVLTAKDDRAVWERYLHETRRLQDLVVFSPTEAARFNFLDWELHRAGRGAGLTENLVNLFSEVLAVAERPSGGGGREDEGYWRRAMRQMVRNCIDLLMLGPGTVSVPDLYRVVVSLPSTPAQVNDSAWQERSFAYACLQAADRRQKSAMRRRDYELCADYTLLEFPALAEKTRSIIVSTFTSMADILQRGVLRELFCGETNITPEATGSGKVLLMDLPVKEFGEAGRTAQVIMKYVFMRSIERRQTDDSVRPVFLFCDESQNFVSPYDYQFQATARSARVCTVYLTQNLPNYYAALGAGEEGKASVDSLVGNMVTKILHSNSDPTTNEWAAGMIGRTRQFFMNASRSEPVDMVSAIFGLDGQSQTSGGVSETMEYEVPPQRFTRLRKGGLAHGGLIDGIVFQGGRRFRATGRTWLPVTFRQPLNG